MLGSASPRKPRVAIESRSSEVRSFEVAWTLEGQQRVVAHHAAAVIDDADQLASAALDFDPNARRACIQRVLKQFLNYRRRPFHHLAGGDLVSDLIGQNADAPHETIVKGSTSGPALRAPL